jgi:hypothetical protein
VVSSSPLGSALPFNVSSSLPFTIIPTAIAFAKHSSRSSSSLPPRRLRRRPPDASGVKSSFRLVNSFVETTPFVAISCIRTARTHARTSGSSADPAICATHSFAYINMPLPPPRAKSAITAPANAAPPPATAILATSFTACPGACRTAAAVRATPTVAAPATALLALLINPHTPRAIPTASPAKPFALSNALPAAAAVSAALASAAAAAAAALASAPAAAAPNLSANDCLRAAAPWGTKATTAASAALTAAGCGSAIPIPASCPTSASIGSAITPSQYFTSSLPHDSLRRMDGHGGCRDDILQLGCTARVRTVHAGRLQRIRLATTLVLLLLLLD